MIPRIRREFSSITDGRRVTNSRSAGTATEGWSSSGSGPSDSSGSGRRDRLERTRDSSRRFSTCTRRGCNRLAFDELLTRIPWMPLPNGTPRIRLPPSPVFHRDDHFRAPASVRRSGESETDANPSSRRTSRRSRDTGTVRPRQPSTSNVPRRTISSSGFRPEGSSRSRRSSGSVPSGAGSPTAHIASTSYPSGTPSSSAAPS